MVTARGRKDRRVVVGQVNGNVPRLAEKARAALRVQIAERTRPTTALTSIYRQHFRLNH
jgi:aminoglycoside phosphotransferase